MNVSEILARMIGWPGNTRHDVEHLLKVWGYARTIGQLESQDDQSQRVLEIAAIVHDIACPMLRETTGSCPGKRQEEAGPALAAADLTFAYAPHPQMASATDARYGQKESSDQNFDYMFKILIIGNSSVGKTSFLFRYADDSFTPAFVSTVGIDFKVKTIYRYDLKQGES